HGPLRGAIGNTNARTDLQARHSHTGVGGRVAQAADQHQVGFGIVPLATAVVATCEGITLEPSADVDCEPAVHLPLVACVEPPTGHTHGGGVDVLDILSQSVRQA